MISLTFRYRNITGQHKYGYWVSLVSFELFNLSLSIMEDLEKQLLPFRSALAKLNPEQTTSVIVSQK